MKLSIFVSSFTISLLTLSVTSALDEVIEGTANPEALPITGDEQALISKLSYPSNMRASVYAREPFVQNPTAISIDEQGRLYIAETHRFDRGIEDNRRNIHWLADDFACKTTEDRRAMYEKHAAKKSSDYYTEYDEKIRVILDTDNDGRADKQEVYAEGFNDALDGTAAGVFAANGKVYFACIPHVWMLEDTDGDLKSDKRESLQEGFGVSVSYSGHDLNGFKFGPDGRIYFSIGDRAYNLKTKEGKILKQLNAGAVFRMEADGSDLTEVHTGLRNPKEIAFDNYGNLFTVDNNGDMGDLARVVHIVEGGYSGWHRGHQHLNNFKAAIGASARHKPMWVSEKQWDIAGENRPAALLPPVAHISNGPSGLVFNPGIGLSEEWDNHFFVCDYKGSNSSVIGFELKAQGASFKEAHQKKLFTGMLNTDIEFGFDGKLYVSDYVGSWPTHGYGSILCFENDEALAKKEAAEVSEIFSNGFEDLQPERLIQLLSHVDQRVRYRAQFELAKSPENAKALYQIASQGTTTLERLHGTWGLGILLRKQADRLSENSLIKLCQSSDSKVRGQAAKALGQNNVSKARNAVAALLGDVDSNTAMLAGIALGRLGAVEDVPALLSLAERAGEDHYLRHGAVEGLAGIGVNDELLAASDSSSRLVRLAVLLTLRELKHPAVANFLDDSEGSIVVEAIQAINDTNIEDARLELAKATRLIGKYGLAVDNRLINASFRIGSTEAIQRIMILAADGSKSVAVREEALFALENWMSPNDIDLSTGLYSPVTSIRDVSSVMPWLSDRLVQLVKESEGSILAGAMKAADSLGVKLDLSVLSGLVKNESIEAEVRLAALASLGRQAGEDSKANVFLENSLTSVRPEDPCRAIRLEALLILAENAPDEALKRIKCAIKEPVADLRGAQDSYSVLGGLKHSDVDQILKGKMINLRDVTRELRLDVIEAARHRDGLTDEVKAYDSQFDPSRPMEAFVDAEFGGDVEKGRDVFFNHAASQCTQCHVAEKGLAGGVAGPNLTNVGAKRKSRYLLESLVEPSATLAPGYVPISFQLKTGLSVSGILMSSDDNTVSVKDVETGVVSDYSMASVEALPQSYSSMPPFGLILKKKEVRDLVAYLESLHKGAKKKKATH